MAPASCSSGCWTGADGCWARSTPTRSPRRATSPGRAAPRVVARLDGWRAGRRVVVVASIGERGAMLEPVLAVAGGALERDIDDADRHPARLHEPGRPYSSVGTIS